MYSARISRNNPSLFVILIDQSGSMQDNTLFNNELISKSQAVSLSVNMLISELLNRSRREEGHRDYFEIAVLGYHDDQVVSLLHENSIKLMRLSQLAGTEQRKVTLHKERRLPDGRTRLASVDLRVWIEAHAHGQTPMCKALHTCHDLVKKWCTSKAHQFAYPPSIFNITDGEASDGSDDELLKVSKQIKNLSTRDGNVLLFNIHISSNKMDTPVVFPSSTHELPTQRYAHLLYDMSSEMPTPYRANIVSLKGETAQRFQGVSYNASMTDVISMMNIGSVSVSLLD